MFYDLAKSMAKRGHAVHVICLKKKSDLQTLDQTDLCGAVIHGVNPIIEDKGGTLLSYKQHFTYLLSALLKGSSVIREEKIDIIHANTLTPAVPAKFLSSVYRIPLIMTVHHVFTQEWGRWSSQTNISETTSVIGPLYEKLVLKMRPNMVHVVSDTTKQQFQKLNPKTVSETIYYGVDLDSYAAVKIEYKKFILYVGRLVINKNLQVVILALKEVVRKIPDAKLVVVGDGPMRSEWEELVIRNNLGTNVDFLGFVSQEIKLNLMARCSALVFPSVHEGFGLVTTEAFAMSKPVLASNVEPFNEIIDNNVDGFLLPPHDPLRWTEKINFILTNEEACRNMGEKGKKKVIEKFNLNILNTNLQHIYSNLIARK